VSGRECLASVPYGVPFAPSAYRNPARLRRPLGYGTGYPVSVAAVGGTAVGRHLREQQHFVRHRLNHHGAGTALDFATTSPRQLAAAITAAAARPIAYRAVPAGGAARAARRLAELLVR
jgi:hypothetical protein